MTELLLRRFVPDYKNINDTRVRTNYGFLSGIVGIIVNVILCCIKLAIGVISGSIAIVGDAIHNLADAGASVVTMLGFKLSAKPADQEHPFGHGRIEYIAGLIIAGAIILIGVELLKSSVEKLLNPVEAESSLTTIAILVISVMLQLWLGLFNRGLGKRINAPAMLATAADSLSDCVATVVVIVCQCIHLFAGIDLDGGAGTIVALFIIHSGWNAAMDTLTPLLGSPPDPSYIRGIRTMVLHEPKVIGMHDLIVHNYGPGRVFVSLHAEIPSTLDIMTAHDIINDLEEKIHRSFQAVVVVHMDPVVVDDQPLSQLKVKLMHVVQTADPFMSVHDVRLAADNKVVFDVAVPYRCEMTDHEIRQFIREEMSNKAAKYQLSIRVDRLYDSDDDRQ